MVGLREIYLWVKAGMLPIARNFCHYTTSSLPQHLGLGIHLWRWSMMWFMCSDEIFIQNMSFIASNDMSHDHSISFVPTIMLQWWGSDRAVQSQCCLPLSHCHLTLLPFHRNHPTLAVVCLSSTVIASPNRCNTTSTILYNYLLILSWQFDCERFAVTLPTLRQDYKHAPVKKLWYGFECC